MLKSLNAQFHIEARFSKKDTFPTSSFTRKHIQMKILFTVPGALTPNAVRPVPRIHAMGDVATGGKKKPAPKPKDKTFQQILDEQAGQSRPKPAEHAPPEAPGANPFLLLQPGETAEAYNARQAAAAKPPTVPIHVAIASYKQSEKYGERGPSGDTSPPKTP